MRLNNLPENTKELLEHLRNIESNDQQILLSAYTQALTLLTDDIHSLFIFLDYINLSLDSSEPDEIEHLYTLFKVKMRKFKIFWIEYLKFEVERRNKDFDVSFGKIVDYLKLKEFEGKLELLENLIKDKEVLRKQIGTTEPCSIRTPVERMNLDTDQSQARIDAYSNESTQKSIQDSQNFNEKASDNVITDPNSFSQSDLNLSPQILTSSADLSDKENNHQSEKQAFKDTAISPEPSTLKSLDSNTLKSLESTQEISTNELLNSAIFTDPSHNHSQKQVTEKSVTAASLNTKNLLSTPSGIKTWTETQKSINIANQIDSVPANELKRAEESKILFELEMSRSQDTAKLRFSPKKRMPFRNDTEKPKFLDITSTPKKAKLCESFENPTASQQSALFFPFKGKELLLISKIGSGGYSNVYRVTYNQEIYALKQIRLEEEDDSELYKREISLLSSLKDCGFVIQMIDYEVRKDVVNILFEYGETDLQKLIKSGTLNMFYIKYIWESILRILVFIHSNKILHRDIKPANFVLVKGKLKIIDFGISRSVRSGDTTSILNIEKAGTLNYIAPEQCSKEKVGRSADIWSAGCILYNMIYRKNIHKDCNVVNIMRAITEEREIEFGEADPKAIETMKACLVYNPKMRAKPEDLLNYPFLKK